MFYKLSEKNIDKLTETAEANTNRKAGAECMLFTEFSEHLTLKLASRKILGVNKLLSFRNVLLDFIGI